MNCILGGTGAGKSLILEAIRFALDQQVDGGVFKAIREEVDSRLAYALGDRTEVRVVVATPDGRYRVRRTFGQSGSRPLVDQDVDGEWVGIDRSAVSLLAIAAYSQGEVLEYARQPVGRVGLVDAHLDLAALDTRVTQAEANLRVNAGKLIAARTKVNDLNEKASRVVELEERERELSGLFTPELVQELRLWTSEQGELKSLSEQVEAINFAPLPEAPQVSARITDHETQYQRIRVAQAAVATTVTEAESSVNKSIAALKSVVAAVRTELDAEFEAVQAKLDLEVEKLGGASLKGLLNELKRIQTEVGGARLASDQLKKTAQPRLDALQVEREALLVELKTAKDERRGLRRARTQELNSKTAGLVKIDIRLFGSPVGASGTRR